MKRSLVLAAILLSIVVHLKAQDLNGFNFRAQVSDENDKLLLSEKIELDIILLSGSIEYYHEKQSLTTDEVGFFNITIGKGIPLGGSFTTIPWYKENISLKLSYKKENDSNYFSLGAPRLYSVPYALYAKTAGEITNDLKVIALGVNNQKAATSGTNVENATETDNGIASKSDMWSMYGNRLASMRQGFIGTTDNSPLILKSAGEKRAEFSTDGVLQLASNLVIDSTHAANIANMDIESLKVSDKADIQKLHIIGEEASASPETGALIVNGGVGINKTLNVKEDVIANRNIKAQDIEFVNGVVKGDLTIDKLVKLNNATESDNEQTGSLVTSGGIGIAKNLNVGQTISTKDLQVDGTARFNIVANSNLVVDNNITTKSLKVNEGSDLNILTVSGPATLKKDITLSDDDRSTITINGKTLFNAVNSVKNTTESISPADGALTVAGGVGITKNLNVGQKITTLDFQSDGNSKFNTVTNSNLTVDNLTTTRNLQVNETATVKTLEVRDKSGFKNNVTIGDAQKNASLTIEGNSTVNGISAIANNTESTKISEGALTVSGGVGIARNLNVGQKVRTSTLQVDGISQFNSDINISNANLTTDKLITTKSLAVTDDGTIKTLNVTGVSNFQNDVTIGGNTNSNITVNGKTNIAGIARMTDLTQSSTPADGALTIAGGVGIAKNLNVGQKITTLDFQSDGSSKFNNVTNSSLNVDNLTTTKTLLVNESTTLKTLDVQDKSSFKDDVIIGDTQKSANLVVSGISTIANNKESTKADEGALVVSGGAGIARNLNVGQKIRTNNLQVDGTSQLNGDINISNANLISDKLITTKSLAVTDDGTIKTLNVTGVSNFQNDVTIGGNTNSNITVNGKTNITGTVKVTDATQSSTPADGALTVAGGAGIAKSLNVGEKINTVDFQSKMLTSDKLAITDLATTKSLSVTENTDLKTLNITGKTTFKNDVDFGDVASNIKSNLLINGDVNLAGGFNSTLKVNNATDVTFKNYTQDNGSVNIQGGARIAKNLNVAGKLAVQDEFYAKKIDADQFTDVNITSTNNVVTADNTTDRIGALNVAGGAKVDLNMIVGGNLRVEGKINAANGFGVASNLTIDPYTKFADASAGTGKLAGPVGNDMRTEDKDKFALYINAINHGVAIKVNRNETKAFSDADLPSSRATDNDATPTKNNEFMSFVDKRDNIIGGIEGQTLDDMHQSLTFKQLEENIAETELRRGYEMGLASLKGVMAGLKLNRASKIGARVAFDVVSAADQATPKGLAAPNFVTAGQMTLRASLISTFDALTIASEMANILAEATNFTLKAKSLAKSKQWYNEKKADMEKNVGVKYTSRSADYAEWLPLQNTTENIVHGDVVGVKGGKIIKNYTGQTVEKFMVASTAPAIVGAVPEDKTNYREIAFIGQVPVNIIGNIQIGDYVLPSQNGDGLAIAKSKSAMLLNDYKQIVGVAWSGKDNFGKANVAIGINQNDMADVISNLDTRLSAVDARLSAIEKMITDNQQDYQAKSDSALAAMKKIQEDNQAAADSANSALDAAQQSLLDLQKQLADMQNQDPGDDNPSGSPSDPSGTTANETNPIENNATDFMGMIYTKLKSDKNFKEMIDAYIKDSDNDIVKNFPNARVGKDLYVKEFVESDFIRPIKESLGNEVPSAYTAEERDSFLNFYSQTLQKYFLGYQN